MLASLVGYVRRRLSITAVKQQTKLLLDRLQLLGDGAAAAAARRQRAVQLEQAAVRERGRSCLGLSVKLNSISQLYSSNVYIQ